MMILMTPALEHLLIRMRPLNRALRAAVARQGRAAARLFRPDVTPLCVTEDQVLTLLSDVDQLLDGRIPAADPSALTPEERLIEDDLRARCRESGVALPLDRLREALELNCFEQEAILLCAAVELDRSYERIYAYVLDDLNRRYPCLELLTSLTAEDLAGRCARRQALSRYGKLRRTGILLPCGEPATELRQELRLAPMLFDYLTGNAGDPTGLFHDEADVTLPDRIDLPPEMNPDVVHRSARALREGHVEVLGIWSARHGCPRETAVAIALAAGMPLRRFLFSDPQPDARSIRQQIDETIRAATALGAILWIDADLITDAANDQPRNLDAVLADRLAASRIPIILTGIQPWRPLALLENRPYAEIELEARTWDARREMWKHALPDVDSGQREDLARRFRLQNSELRAIAQVARAQAWLAGNGHPAPLDDQLEIACAAVARKFSHRFAAVIKPRRTADDLILPDALHKQVLEVAGFFRSWPQVSDGWGFGRMITGEGGIKALFTGDSGTGKTLAAEVIAGQLQMPLLKVDLSRIVSKWVGETEKHLEQAFREAEDSHAVLFFDEADALFGKRGEVRHGIDRYANLEVSYLLQRLEDYYGLVILASNLRDNIDKAFTRRFQIVLHFPRPGLAERRRLWELAFPKNAPLEADLDLDLLAGLDLTGAGIVGAAQTAALLALESGDGNSVINKSHLVRAIARQYQRESRLLTSSDLGAYGTLLQGAG